MVCEKSRDGKHSVSEKNGKLVCFFCDLPYSEGWNDAVPVAEHSEFITLRTDSVYALRKELSVVRKLLRRDNPEAHLHKVYEFKVLEDVLDTLLLKGTLDKYFDKVSKARSLLSLNSFLKQEIGEDDDE